MKESFYFSHDFNARNDRKMVHLIRQHKLRGIGAFWCIVEMLFEEGGSLKLSECERIAYELRDKTEFIRMIVEESGLFKNDGSSFWSDSVNKRIEKRNNKSEKARESASYRWQNANAMRHESKRNAIKERKGKKRKEIKGNEFKEDLLGANAQKKSEEEVRFEKFNHWISENAKRVSEMKYPFTIDQFKKIREEFKNDQVKDMLLKMHNYKPLLTKNLSANLTLRNWMKIENDRSAGKKINGLNSHESNGIAADILRIREQENQEQHGNH